MRGLITYTCNTTTPQQGMWDMYQPWLSPSPWLSEVPSGTDVSIYLKGYAADDPDFKTQKSVSSSTANVKQTRYFGREEMRKITIRNVLEDRSTYNPYSVYNALNYAADEGIVLTWYPNVDDYPTEFYSCIVQRARPPRRESTLLRWNFTLELTILPEVQFPSTVPVFV
jgi:hypothetical protein